MSGKGSQAQAVSVFEVHILFKTMNVPVVSCKQTGSWVWRGLGLALLLSHQAATPGYGAGAVAAWGDDNAGQVSQIPVAALSGATAVAGGGNHSLALLTNGTVVAWGLDNDHQADVPAGLTNVIAIAAGSDQSMALTAQGTVVTWGEPETIPNGLTNIMAIAAGGEHNLAVRSDGTVVAWGDNSYNQSDVPAGLTNVIAVAAGNYFSMALLADGAVTVWGDNTYGQTNLPALGGNTLAIAAGGDHCLAVGVDGTVTAWGRNDYGQATPPSDLTNVVAIAGGALHSLALRSDGTLAGWGNDAYGQSDASPSQMGYCAVAAGDYHSLTIRGDGSPVVLVEPASQTVFVGVTATFQALVVGTPPMAFQWQKNGSNVTGAVTSSYMVPNVQTNDGGAFTLVISNFTGITKSEPAVLAPLPIPARIVITKPPQSALVDCGEATTFQVSATGPKPLSYQWLFQAAPIQNATNTTLTLVGVTNGSAGQYSVLVTCPSGSVTSRVAALTVNPVSPAITSPLTATAVQGQPFTYTVTGTHNPTLYRAVFLPPGLTLDPTNGSISGTNFENGTFYVQLDIVNACAGDSKTLVLDVASGAPVITSAASASGVAGSLFTYAITATPSPTSYSAQNLPPGVIVDPHSGVVSGIPAYEGDFDATILASNPWGTAAAPLEVSVGYGPPISGLSIVDVHTNYSKPYLLDIEFGLRDNDNPTNGNPLVVDPSLLSVAAFEDTNQVDSTETALILKRVLPNTLTLQENDVFLVLDFSEDISSVVLNGDSYGDGISDAAHAEINSAEVFVTQQPASSQIGVYEFHRKDVAPNQVVGLTNATAAYDAIAGLWTNYINYYTSDSRAWDALGAAVQALGKPSNNQLHSIVLVSDGNDNSSTAILTNVLKTASNNAVQIYCVGFGQDINTNALSEIVSETGGLFYTGETADEIASEFAQVGKVFAGIYRLRWVTPKNSGDPAFMPSFSVSYQGYTATSPTNPVWVSNFNIVSNSIDTNTTPPTTNSTTNGPFYTNVTNFIYFSFYKPATYAGDVDVGLLDLQPNAALPSGVSLYANYLPENIRQFNLHFRLNWPGTILPATNMTDLLAGWSAVPRADGSNGIWLLLSSPQPTNPAYVQTVSLPWGDWGSLLDVNFRDQVSTNAVTSNLTAFAFFVVDTNIYKTNIPGYFGQTMSNNVNGMVTNLPVLPLGTPVAWLIANGFTTPSAWTNDETLDSDHDGMLNWQEYQANTNPNDPKSKLAIGSVVQSPLDGRWEITFVSALNRSYQVQASTNYSDWRIVQDGIPGTGTNITVTDTTFIPSSQTFYRLLAY
jgi:hypothetical protein